MHVGSLLLYLKSLNLLKMLGIGVMSGSSLDGLDIVAVEFSEERGVNWNIIAYYTYSITEEMTMRLTDALNLKVCEMMELQSEYSQLLCEIIQSFVTENKLAPSYIAIHGHTLVHSPEYKSSWQLLNGGLVAASLSCPVICDFRNQDMALGGQGTPMAVLADRDLYPGYDYYINLGGIANCSYINSNKWVAYDLFPFNQVLNAFAQKLGHPYDRNGFLSSRGIVNAKLLHTLNNEAYVNAPYPKSIDNTWVKEYWMQKLNNSDASEYDVMRTYIEFAAEQISYLVDSDSKILWTGGGAHHLLFMEVLASKKAYNMIPDKQIVDSKESVLIAYAGYLRWHRQPNFVSSATGATRDVIGGAVYF